MGKEHKAWSGEQREGGVGGKKAGASGTFLQEKNPVFMPRFFFFAFFASLRGKRFLVFPPFCLFARSPFPPVQLSSALHLPPSPQEMHVKVANLLSSLPPIIDQNLVA